MFFIKNINNISIVAFVFMFCVKLCFCLNITLPTTEETNYENNTKEVNNATKNNFMSSTGIAMDNYIHQFVNSSISSDTSFEEIKKIINESGIANMTNNNFNNNTTIELSSNINLDKSNPCGWKNLTNIEKQTLIILINEKADKDDIRVVADNILVPRWIAFCVSLAVVLIILIVAILLFIICCNGKK